MKAAVLDVCSYLADKRWICDADRGDDLAKCTARSQTHAYNGDCISSNGGGVDMYVEEGSLRDWTEEAVAFKVARKEGLDAWKAMTFDGDQEVKNVKLPPRKASRISCVSASVVFKWASLVLLMLSGPSLVGAQSIASDVTFDDFGVYFEDAFGSALDDIGGYFADAGSCVSRTTSEFAGNIFKPLTTGYRAAELDNMVPCNMLPLQRTPLLDDTLSEFSYLAPFDFLFEILQYIFDVIGCFIPEFNVDVAALVEAIVPALDEEGLFDGSKSFLGFDPVPYLYGYLGIEDSCIASSGECAGGNPCCHFQSEGKVWYNVVCEEDGKCGVPDTANIEASCTAENWECASSTECCQYSDDTDDIHICDKELVDGKLSETGICKEHPEQPFGWNPLCAAWNYGAPLDTLAFSVPLGFPPLAFDPVGLNAVLPNKGLIKKKAKQSSRSVCSLHRGIKLAEIPSLGLVVLLKFFGFGGSKNRLEYGSNLWTRGTKFGDAVPAVWDGFLSIPLPPKPGVDFWMALRFEFYPLPLWKWKEFECSLPSGSLPGIKSDPGYFATKKLVEQSMEIALRMTFEVYVDGGDDSTGACVIVTMPQAVIKLSVLQFTIGRGIGGWCKNGTPNRCTPSGFFLNIEPTFEAKSTLTKGALNLILSGLEEADAALDEEVVEPFGGLNLSKPVDIEGGFSLGVFVDDVTNDVKAVVFRLEIPVIKIFGISTGLSAKVHFQWFKGSELERRRASILRISGEPNCPDTVAGCNSWKPYELYQRDDAGDILGGDVYGKKAEICEDRLLDLDRYNLIMIAQVTDPKAARPFDSPKRIESDNLPTIWYGNTKFYLEDYQESGIVVVYAQLSTWLMPLVKLTSLSFIIIVNTIDGTDYNFGLNENGEVDLDESSTEAEIKENRARASEQATAAIDGNEKQNVYIEIELEITVLFLVSLQAAASIYNNPLGNGAFDDWVVGWLLKIDGSVFAQIEISGVSEPFKWNELVRRRQLEEASEEERHRMLEESTPDPEMNIQVKYEFPLGELILEGLKIVWDGIVLVVEAIGKAVVEIVTAVADFFVNVAGAVAEFFENSFAGVGDACSGGPLDCLGAIGEGIAKVGEKIWGALVDVGKDIENAFGEGGFFDELFGPVDEAVIGFFAGRSWYEYAWAENLGLPKYTTVKTCKSSGASFCHDDLMCPVRIRYKVLCNTKSWCFSGCSSCGVWEKHDVERNNNCREEVARKAAEVNGQKAEAEHMEDVVRENNEEHVKGLKFVFDNLGSNRNLLGSEPVNFDTTSASTEFFPIANKGTAQTKGVKMNPVSNGMPILAPDSNVPEVLSAVPLGSEFDIDFFDKTDEELLEELETLTKGPARDQVLSKTRTEGTEFSDYRLTISPPTLSYGGSKTIEWSACKEGMDEKLAKAWPFGSPAIIGKVTEYLATLSLVVEVDSDLTNQVSSLKWKTKSSAFECSGFEVTVEVRAVDNGGRKSEPLEFTVTIPYGRPEIATTSTRAQRVRTRCHNEDYDAVALQQYNMDVPYQQKGTCPSPNIELINTDRQTSQGIECTEMYTEIERTWKFQPTDECQLSSAAAEVRLVQTITLGGLQVPTLSQEVVENLENSELSETEVDTEIQKLLEKEMPTPATPSFNVMDKIYYLSNERDNGNAIFDLEDVLDLSSIADECGAVCLPPVTKPSPFENGEKIGCDKVGEHQVSVAVTNKIGIEVSKMVTVTVVDPHPPVSLPRVPFDDVDLNNEEFASISNEEVDFDSYDNCEIVARELSRLPGDYGDACNEDGSACEFSCKDTYGGGPFDVFLTVTDPSGHTATNATEVKVLDASDRDQDGLRDCAESLIYFTDPDQADENIFVLDAPADGESLPPVYSVRLASPEEAEADFQDSCSGEEPMGTLFELNGDGTTSPGAGSGSEFCPNNGKLKILEASIVSPVMSKLADGNSGFIPEVVRFAVNQNQQDIFLPGMFFQTTGSDQLRVQGVSISRFYSMLHLTNEQAVIYARQVSQPIVKVQLRCTTSDVDPPGTVYFRLSRNHPECEELVLEDYCPAGLVVGEAYYGWTPKEECPQEAKRELLRGRNLENDVGQGNGNSGGEDGRSSGDTVEDSSSGSNGGRQLKRVNRGNKGGKGESQGSGCILDRGGEICPKEYEAGGLYCLDNCLIFPSDENEWFGKSSETGRQVPLCCRTKENIFDHLDDGSSQ